MSWPDSCRSCRTLYAFRGSSLRRGGSWTAFISLPAIRTAIPKGRLLSTTARCKVRRRFAMPTRSLSSPVLKWPDRQSVDQAVRRWAENVVQQRQDVVRIGYFGSYARGDWGVGSDLDLLVVVESSDQPPQRRAATWDMIELPVPTDLLVSPQEGGH